MFTRLLGRMFFPPRARSYDEGVRLKFPRSASIRPKRPIRGSERSVLRGAKPQSHRSGYLTHSAFAAVLRCILSMERNHLQCSRVPNLILMKTDLEKEIEVTESWECPNCGSRTRGLPDRVGPYVQLFDFKIQCRPWNFASGGRPDLTQQLFRGFPREPLRWVPGCQRTPDTSDFKRRG